RANLGAPAAPSSGRRVEFMRLRFAYLVFCLSCVVTASIARAQSANPPETPSTPTGADVPSDVKQPSGPHKPFDFTVYGRVNVSFDVGNQELTGAPCITAAVNPCTPPAGQLRWLPDLASNLSRLGVRG